MGRLMQQWGWWSHVTKEVRPSAAEGWAIISGRIMGVATRKSHLCMCGEPSPVCWTPASEITVDRTLYNIHRTPKFAVQGATAQCTL